MNPIVTAFVHEPTASLTYVVREPGGSHCAVVDPVLDSRRIRPRGPTPLR